MTAESQPGIEVTKASLEQNATALLDSFYGQDLTEGVIDGLYIIAQYADLFAAGKGKPAGHKSTLDELLADSRFGQLPGDWESKAESVKLGWLYPSISSANITRAQHLVSAVDETAEEWVAAFEWRTAEINAQVYLGERLGQSLNISPANTVNRATSPGARRAWWENELYAADPSLESDPGLSVTAAYYVYAKQRARELVGDRVGPGSVSEYLPFMDGLLFMGRDTRRDTSLRDNRQPILRAMATGSSDDIRAAFGRLAQANPRVLSESTFTNVLGVDKKDFMDEREAEAQRAHEEEELLLTEQQEAARVLRERLEQTGRDPQVATALIKAFGGVVLEDLSPQRSYDPYKLWLPMVFQSRDGDATIGIYSLWRRKGEWSNIKDHFGTVDAGVLFANAAAGRYRIVDQASDELRAGLMHSDSFEAFDRGEVIVQRRLPKASEQ